MSTKPRRADDLRQLLSERQMRVTGPRLAILRELARVKNPISHTELTDRLASSDLDRVTIYRNLLSLTRAGLLVRTQLGDNVWRFSWPRSETSEHGTHPHFVCNDCGGIACLPAASVTLSGVASRNQVAEVQLRGRCTSCAHP